MSALKKKQKHYLRRNLCIRPCPGCGQPVAILPELRDYKFKLHGYINRRGILAEYGMCCSPDFEGFTADGIVVTGRRLQAGEDLTDITHQMKIYTRHACEEQGTTGSLALNATLRADTETAELRERHARAMQGVD